MIVRSSMRQGVGAKTLKCKMKPRLKEGIAGYALFLLALGAQAEAVLSTAEYRIDRMAFNDRAPGSISPSGATYVQGYIVTNGRIGVLATADLISWSLTFSDDSYSSTFNSADFAQGSSRVNLRGNGLNANSEGLYFDFSQESTFGISRFSSVDPSFAWSMEGNCPIQRCPGALHERIDVPTGPGFSAHTAWAPRTAELERIGVRVFAVPEPATLVLVTGALFAALGTRKRWRPASVV